VRARSLASQAARRQRAGCRAAADAPAAAAPAASPSFFATLLKKLKLFAAGLAIDAAKDKAGILRLASNFPPKVQGTFTGLFECYVDQARPRAARAAARACVHRLAAPHADSGLASSDAPLAPAR
jgi:hypothetical protein